MQRSTRNNTHHYHRFEKSRVFAFDICQWLAVEELGSILPAALRVLLVVGAGRIRDRKVYYTLAVPVVNIF